MSDRRRPATRLVVATVLGVLLAVGVVLGIRLLQAGTGSDPVPEAAEVIESARTDQLPVVGPTGSSDVIVQQRSPAAALPILVPDGVGDQVVDFTVGPDVPNVASTALGYRFDDLGLDRQALAQVLARKFGIGGRPAQTMDGAWVVTGSGGPLPRVRVDAGPMAAWSFDGKPGAAIVVPTPSAAAPSPTATAQPQAGGTQGLATAAESVTRTFLADLGVPVDELDWQVASIDGRTAVTGWQVIAGQRTSASWRMVFEPNGQILQASGFAATDAQLPNLPVLGVVAALQRARQAAWSALGPTLLARAPLPDGARASSSASPAAPVIDAAELSLAQFTEPDGRLLVLPAYLLTGADGSTWSLVSVADEALRVVGPGYYG
jgi:hypothetical protein